MILLAWAVPLAAADPLQIDAGQVVITPERATGTGGVALTLEGAAMQAEAFTYDPATGTLTVEEGRWARPDGQLRFAAGSYVLGTRAARFTDVSLTDPEGRRYAAAGLEILDSGNSVLQQVRFNPCGDLSFTARRAEIVPGEVVRLRGAWLGWGEARLLPLPPLSLPLAERRSGLLAPELGWTDDGLRASLPVYLTLGPAADLRLSPGVWGERGPRLDTRLRYALPEGEGTWTATGAYDWLTQAPRGAATVAHRSERGRTWAAADARVWSDPAYDQDYGESFLSRTTPWTRVRGGAGAGPLRLETDGFQSADPVGQRPLGVVGSAPGQALGPLTWSAQARLDAYTLGRAPWDSAPPDLRAEAGGSLAAGLDREVLRARLQVGGRGVGWQGEAPWAEGWTEGALEVPFWAARPGGLDLLDLGVAGRLGAVAGTPTARAPADTTGPGWAAGPTLRLRRVRSQGVPWSLGVAGLATDDGLQPRLDLRITQGDWDLSATADRDLQTATLASSGAPLRLTLATAHTELLWEAHGRAAVDLPGALQGWTPGWQAVVDLQDPGLLRHGPTVSWTPPCGCLRAAAALEWSDDQDGPDLGGTVEFW